jgi:hypothetical protein
MLGEVGSLIFYARVSGGDVGMVWAFTDGAVVAWDMVREEEGLVLEWKGLVLEWKGWC